MYYQLIYIIKYRLEWKEYLLFIGVNTSKLDSLSLSLSELIVTDIKDQSNFEIIEKEYIPFD